jgi:DNA (cytosine-5)-methyltransferase 1
MTFRVYEFFAGGGMARIGLGAEHQCVFANDIDYRKGAAYKANFGAGELKVCDVANLTSTDLPDADLDWMSPPCQDLSEAGSGAGLEGASSNAFWPCVRLLKALRAEKRAPKLIVYENVTGLLASSGGKDFDAVCDAFVEMDYRIGAMMIDAARFVPQSRERVFIVAIDAALPIPVELVADRPSAPFHPPGLVKACLRQRPAPIWWRLPVPPARNTVLADLIEDTPTGVPWHTQAETNRLIELMAPIHLAKLDEVKRAGKRMVGGLYRRIRPDGAGGKVQRAEIRFDDVAGCLRVPAGGSSRQTIVIVEGASVRSRLLSPREAARLMGLEDSYKLPSNYNDAYGLMGDGVCVNVVRHLAQHLLEPLLTGVPKLETAP